MRKAALIFLVLLPELAFSQAAVTKVVRVRYAKANSIAALITGGIPVIVSHDDALQVIVLKGQPDAVASAEQTIRELDAPSAASTSKDIEVIVAVIGASSGSDLPGEQEMTEGMAPVVKQLRAIFPYKNYQPLSSMLLRSREGARAENRGNMKALVDTANNSTPAKYVVAYNDASVSFEQGKRVIHLRGFQFAASSSSATSIATDIDLPEGQKTVVGKANVEKGDSAFFVVLTARLVD